MVLFVNKPKEDTNTEPMSTYMKARGRGAISKWRGPSYVCKDKNYAI